MEPESIKTSRRFGLIAKWNDEKGFGFIAPRGGGKEIFVHAKSFRARDRRPRVGDSVSFVVSTDDRGRLRSDEATLLGDDLEAGSRTVRRGANSFCYAVSIVSFVAILAWLGYVPLYVPAIYLCTSLIAFVMYTYDKSAAMGNAWRVSEQSLHFIAIIGGWPGALVGQAVHRHKTKKASFRFGFWLTVFANCLALAAIAILFGLT